MSPFYFHFHQVLFCYFFLHFFFSVFYFLQFFYLYVYRAEVSHCLFRHSKIQLSIYNRGLLLFRNLWFDFWFHIQRTLFDFPFFVLFVRTGIREARNFVLSIVYFLMVVFSYLGLLFVMELSPQMESLVPSLALDYSVFNTILVKLFVPFIILCIVVHFLGINSYQFRFPNKSKILNYTMLIQAAIAVALIILTAELNLMIYVLMSSTILLSFAFGYKKTSVFANAAFASLVSIAFMALYLYKILIL